MTEPPPRPRREPDPRMIGRLERRARDPLDPHPVDAWLERVARTRAARVAGWSLVAAWCVFILVGIVVQTR